MNKKINLEDLSDEEAKQLLLKTLEHINKTGDNIIKTLNNSINYCRSLKVFSDKYPALLKNYINSEN